MPPPPSEDNTDYSNKVASFKGREYIAIDHERMELAETTLEVWVYPTSVRGWRAIRNDIGWETGDIHWQFLNGKLEFSLRGARPTDQWFGYTFEENNWYHIAMTYSVQNKEVRLYLNGELSETKKYDRAVPFLAADAQIGNWPGRAYLGYMKEFRMWKSIRTLEQIKASYKSLLQATDEEKSAGLISLFPLDGHARDLTGGYSGTFKAKYEEASGKAEESIPWNTCLACKSFKCKKGEYRKGTCTKDTVPDGYTCNQCDNLACSSDEFQTGECKGETNQLQCTAQPLCAAGQYFTGGSGTESGKCSACPQGTFRSEDSHREIECAEHVECSVDEHEVQEASPSQNRVCETTKECSANQYESKAPSSDGNRECTGITACTAGQILVTKSTPKTDNVCKDCNGIDEYVGWQSKSECQPMATCGKGQYVTAVGSATSNLACGGCAASTYQGLDSHRLTECTPQPKCDTGQFASNALAKREPLTCEACREGTYMEQTKHRERRCKSYSVRSCGYDEFLENVGSSTRDQLCTLCPDGQVQNKGYHKDTSCEDTTTTTNTTTSTRTRTTKTATTKTSTTATTTTVSTTTITTPIPPTMRDDATGRPDLVQDAVDDFDQVQDDLVAVDKDLVSAESKLADLKKVADDCEDLEVGCDTARSNVAAAQDDVKSLQKQQSDLESAIKDAAVQLGVAASSNTLICGIDRTCGGGNADNSTTVAIVVVALVLVLAIVGAVVYVSRAKAQTGGGYDAPTSFENPMYDSYEQRTNPAYADPAYADPNNGGGLTGYMDVSPNAGAGASASGYMDVSPNAGAGAPASGYMDVSPNAGNGFEDTMASQMEQMEAEMGGFGEQTTSGYMDVGGADGGAADADVGEEGGEEV